MWSAPKRRTPSATMRSTSTSIATSPATASASPPRVATMRTVSAAAPPSMSQTTMRAPSSAKSSAASRPMPIPAPVISATLPSSLDPIRASVAASDALEVSHELPVRHRPVEGLLLEPAMMEIVIHDLRAERLARLARALELVEGLAQRLRHLAERRVLVRIPLVERGGTEALRDAVEAGGDRRREGEIRVRVRAGNAILDAEARTFPAKPEAAGAIVPAAGDARRREAPRLIALVRIDGRRVEVRELAGHRHLAAEPLLEERRAPARAAGREQVPPALPVPQGRMQVKRRARPAHVGLRHERDRGALGPGDLFHAVLVEHVAVGHLERIRIAQVDLLLPARPLPFRELHRHARHLHGIAYCPHQPLFARGLQDVVVLEVARHGCQPVIPLRARLVEGLAEEIQLELRGGLDEESLLLRSE